MSRRTSILLGFLILMLASLACNAFAGGEPEPGITLPPPAVTDVTTTPGAVDGLAPTITPPGATAVPNDPNGTPTVRVLVDLNIRTGPGVQYDRVDFLLANATAPIIGRDPSTGWWKIACPPNITSTNECWISGGAQYSQASNAQNVPVAAVPPTPTPRPTNTPPPDQSSGTAVLAAGWLAYVDDTGLWAAPLDTSQSPPRAGAAQLLVADGNMATAVLSPNGQQVAYVTGSFNDNRLGLVDTSGQNNRILVTSQDLPAPSNTDLAAVIANVTWLADGQRLVFNSDVVNLVGPGTGSQRDLWQVDTSGQLLPLFLADSFGGVFAVAGNSIMGGTGDSILRATLEGTNLEEMLTFPFINTASEYIYYPQPVWTANGRRAFVAVPSADPFSGGASFTIWEIPASGTAVQQATISGNVIFNPVRWRADGQQVAFVTQSAADGTAVLTVADGNGTNPSIYATDANLRLFDWSGDGRLFLYAGQDYYAVGQPGQSPLELFINDALLDMQWIDNSSFVVATGQNGDWTLSSITLTGDKQPLVRVNTQNISFDIWTR